MVGEVLILMVRYYWHAVLGLKLVLLKKSVTTFSPLRTLGGSTVALPLFFSLLAQTTQILTDTRSVQVKLNCCTRTSNT